MKTILVPLDGSELADQALPLASALASEVHAALVLAGAVSPPDRWIDSETSKHWEAEERSAAEAYLDSRAEDLRGRGLEVRTRAESGQPQVVISAVADEEGADLIVMTTHGRSGVSRWTLGSVADKVLRTTSTPLLLVHPTKRAPAPKAIERIVLALDGSSLAEAAIPDAEKFAHALGASLLLVRAVVPPGIVYGAEFVPGALAVLEELEAEARAYLQEIAEKVRARGLEVGTGVTVGLPAEVILDTAADNNAGMIVLSTHGRSGLDRWFLGSVADAVVRHGDLPVLVIRTWVSLAPGEQHEEPLMAGVSNVVPAPEFEEASPEREAPILHEEPRPHRPERSPGR